MHTITSCLAPATAPVLKPFCNSLKQVFHSDSPELLSEYLETRASELYDIDERANTLLMMLLVNGATNCALHLLQLGIEIDVHHKNDQGRSALYIACQRGATEVIRELLKFGVSILEPDILGFTPLHIAIEKGLVDIVGPVNVSAKVDLQFRRELSLLFANNITTPLHLAATSSRTMLQAVWEFSPKAEFVDQEGMTALHHAVSSVVTFDNVPFLLDKTKALNLADSRGRTPLSIACLAGDERVVAQLLAAGADPNSGFPLPLFQAYRANSVLIFNLLLQAKAKTDARVLGTARPVEEAEESKRSRRVCKNFDGWALGTLTLLELFSALNETPFVEMLIGAGAMESETSKMCSWHYKQRVTDKAKVSPRVSPLRNLGLRKKEIDPALAARAKGWTVADVLELITEYPQAKDAKGNNLLQISLLANNKLAFLLFLRSLPEQVFGANNDEETALHMAVRLDMPLETIILVLFGANTNALTHERNSPLHALSKNLSSDPSHIATIIEAFRSKDTSMDVVNREQNTPLGAAWEARHDTVFDGLLKAGAQIDPVLVKTCDSVSYIWSERLIVARARKVTFSATLNLFNPWFDPVELPTPLSIVIQKFTNPQCRDQISTLEQLLKLLLGFGADRNQPFVLGMGLLGARTITPLGYATHSGLIVVAKMLLEAGADVNGRTKDFPRPIEIASANQAIDFIQLLKNYNPRIPKSLLSAAAKLPPQVYGQIFHQPANTIAGRRSMRFEQLNRYLAKNEPPSLANSPESSASVSPREDDVDEIEQIENEVGLLYMIDEPTIRNFMRQDTLDELKMRQHNMVRGNRLLYHPARFLPVMLGRLRGCAVSIQNQPVPQTQNERAETEEIVVALLRTIDSTLGIGFEGYDRPERVRLLTNMNIDEENIGELNIYKTGKLVPHNRDIIVLRLISRESALLALLPVGVQIHNYAAIYAKIFVMRPLKQDQWTSVNVVKSVGGFTAIGYGACAIQIQEKNEEPYTAATVRIDGQISCIETTCQTTVTITRSQLQFDPKTPLKIQNHIYQALNAPITYDTNLS